tara:strand:+ start:18028 stop:19338 length:1311 start_codon:yes stop_codon:yes gene_type:complete
MKTLLKLLINKLFSKSNKIYKKDLKRKNIAIVSQFFPPDYAATGQLLDELTKKISSNYPINFNIYTGIPSYRFKKGIKTKKFNKKKNIFIRRTSVIKFFGNSVIEKALNGILFSLRISLILLKRIKFDSDLKLLVYSTEPPFLIFFSWLIFKITKIPFILIVYDIYPDVLTGMGILDEKNALIKIWKILNIKSFEKASEIIVLSKSMKMKLKKYIAKENDKISIIPSWSDPEKIFKINKNDNKFAIKNNLVNTFNILYSGNQGRCHDLETIIDTAFILRKNKSIKFIFIGDGPQNLIIKKLVKELSLTNCIFMPFQEKKLLPLTLNVADLALITLNSFSEGIVAPSKLYGHLAASTPIAVISPKNSYLKKLVEEFSFGRWFINGDADGLSNFIKELKLESDLSIRLGNNGRNYLLENANLKKISEQYYSLFKKHIN